MKRFKASALSYRFLWLKKTSERQKGFNKREEKKMGGMELTCIACLLWVRNSVFDSELLRIIHVLDTVLSTGKEERKEAGSALRSLWYLGETLR